MRYVILLCAILVGACSATGPNATQPVSEEPGVTPIDTAEVARADSGNVSENDAVVSDDTDIISVAEIPKVVAADRALQAPKRVCRRIQRTGSHRYKKVCYTQAEIAASTEVSKEVFGEIHRQQQRQGGN